MLFASITACAFYFSSYFLRRSAASPVNYHYWIHSQLGLSTRQVTELEPIEAKFARRRDELVASIRKANEELAAALLSDKDASERVQAAVQKIHRAQGELQQAVLDHVFEMRAVLTPEQYGHLISLTADALREGQNRGD
jgi:nickel and cobalt resistance protein CnrR